LIIPIILDVWSSELGNILVVAGWVDGVLASCLSIVSWVDIIASIDDVWSNESGDFLVIASWVDSVL